MAYNKTIWQNGSSPAINADNLNNMEDGIKQNEIDITTVAGDLSQLDTRVTAIEAKPDLSFYKFTKVTAFTVPDDNYIEAGRLTETIEAGTYEIKFSITYTYNTTTKSAFFRWSLDGGATWQEVSEEAKDKTDVRPRYYAFPKVLTAGQKDIIFEAKKEAAGDVMTIDFLDIILDRKA